MRIALFTYHRAFNCGAELQAWAMKRFLERHGHVVQFPSCCTAGQPAPLMLPFKTGHRGLKRFAWRVRQFLFVLSSLDVIVKTKIRHRSFLRRFLPECRCDASSLRRHFDVAIVGSDQVWREDLAEDSFPLFLGERIPDSLLVIAYAASLGDQVLPFRQVSRIAHAVKERYSFASVREPLANKCLSPLLGFDLPIVADPSMLVNAEEYEALESDFTPKGDYLLLYTILSDRRIVSLCHRLSERLGVKCRVVAACQYSRRLAPKGVVHGVTADLLLSYIKCAKYVVAESFHGTVFAMLYRKPFVSIRKSREAEVSRPENLLRNLGMERHFATAEDSLDRILGCLTSGYVDDFDSRLERFRSLSASWILSALDRVAEGQS